MEERLDNPYIDDGYAGWQKITLGEEYELKIPGDWTVSVSENQATLESEGERVALICFGEKYGVCSKEFYEEILQKEVTDFQDEFVEGFERIDASYLAKCTIDKMETYHYLKIVGPTVGPTDNIAVVFFDVFESEKEILDYAQAMSYYVCRGKNK